MTAQILPPGIQYTNRNTRGSFDGIIPDSLSASDVTCDSGQPCLHLQAAATGAANPSRLDVCIA
jgi:hypothetical protein